MRIRLQYSSLFCLTVGFVLIVMVAPGARPTSCPSSPTSSSSLSRPRRSGLPRRSSSSASRCGLPRRMRRSTRPSIPPVVIAAIKTIQEILDRHVLVGVEINAESRVKAAQGAALPHLVQNGWTVFLVKINNQAGVTAPLVAESPNAALPYRQSTNRAEPKVSVRPSDVLQRWADVAMYTDRPLKRSLSGLTLEYGIIQIYSRDAGKREAKISFNVGQGTQDLGFRSDVDILFIVRSGRCRGRRRARRGWPADDGLVHLS